jgi:site-specific recombinase XerD
MAATATATVPTPTTLHPDRATWTRESRSYLGTVEAAGKSPNTVATYRASLESWARWRTDQGLSLDPGDATRREAQAWVAHLVASGSKGTAATRSSNVARFYRWMVEEWSIGGEVRPSPFDHVRLPVAVPPRVPVLPQDAMDRLVRATAGTSYADLRDRAVIMLLVDSGLRRSELAALLVEDVDPVARMVRVREGKGDVDAIIPFGQDTADALRHYLRARARHRDADLVETVGVRSDRLRSGLPLFLVDVRGGRRGGITGEAVRFILAKRAAAAGLEHVHPHQLRHTFAHELLAAGVPEGDVMTLGRWKSRKVMDRYGADLREARAAASYVSPLARRKGR